MKRYNLPGERTFLAGCIAGSPHFSPYRLLKGHIKATHLEEYVKRSR